MHTLRHARAKSLDTSIARAQSSVACLSPTSLTLKAMENVRPHVQRCDPHLICVPDRNVPCIWESTGINRSTSFCNTDEPSGLTAASYSSRPSFAFPIP